MTWLVLLAVSLLVGLVFWWDAGAERRTHIRRLRQIERRADLAKARIERQYHAASMELIWRAMQANQERRDRQHGPGRG